MFIKNLRIVANLAKQARRVLESTASDEVKYDLIFSDAISGQISRLGVSLNYYDPDTTFMEDATAYVTALEDKIKEFGDLV